VKFGAINTGVLIFSSLTAAWAVRAAQLAQRKRLILCLATTIVCAFAFLCIKYIEYSHKVHEHILFGRYFDPCVSSGGTELLTKKNECPGSKTTVVWNYDNAAPASGCLPDYTYDQDPHKEGVQAACKVREAKVELKETKNKDNTVTEVERELSATPIATECDEETFGEETGEKKVQKFPCWKVTRQPAVCKPGYFFDWTCKGKCDPKLVGGPSGHAGPYPNAQKCTEARGDKEAAMKSAKDVYTLSDCLQSDNTGILVEYGDHEERGELSRTVDTDGMVASLRFDIDKKLTDPKLTPKAKAELEATLAKLKGPLEARAIEELGRSVEISVKEQEKVQEIRVIADCKAPPPPVAAGDLMADPGGTTLVLGQKAVRPVHEMSVHEEHEREAAGPPPEHTNMFFTIYFAMTGLHGVHVLLGIFVFIWLLIRAVKGHFTPEYFGPIDFAALYWHIVDLIWIFLFPLLYLIH
jgi:heme/copper-type cytochrome/quinol oxidase subunit 3